MRNYVIESRENVIYLNALCVKNYPVQKIISNN